MLTDPVKKSAQACSGSGFRVRSLGWARFRVGPAAKTSPEKEGCSRTVLVDIRSFNDQIFSHREEGRRKREDGSGEGESLL